MPPTIGIVMLTLTGLTLLYLALIAYHTLYVDAWQNSESYYNLQIGITDTAKPKKD